MLVGDYMTRDVLTITESTTVAEALRLMLDRGVNRLPVVDEAGALSGIVSDMDLRIAEASGSLTSRVHSIMTTRLFTVGEYEPLEQAAAVMRQRGIGGLPVVRGDQLVGIITDGDVFEAFADLLGVNRSGLRLAVEVGNAATAVSLLGELLKVGANLVGLGLSQREGRTVLVAKATDVASDVAQSLVEASGGILLDVLEEL